MPERADELDDQSRAVLADLFTSALATPDPGSTVDLDSILQAARAAEPGPLQAVGGTAGSGRSATDPDGRPVDHDAIGRPPGRVRLWQTLGGLAAAAALVFGVVQFLPSQAADSAAMSEAPARAAEAPAASSEAASAGDLSSASAAESGEAFPAPLQAAEDSAEGGGAASSDGDQAAESAAAAPETTTMQGEASTAPAAACALPSAAVLDAAAAAAPEWTVAERVGTDGCLGFRMVGPDGEFDVLIVAEGRPTTLSPMPAATAGTDPVVQAFLVLGASPESGDLDRITSVATSVVEAVAAAAG